MDSDPLDEFKAMMERQGMQPVFKHAARGPLGEDLGDVFVCERNADDHWDMIWAAEYYNDYLQKRCIHVQHLEAFIDAPPWMRHAAAKEVAIDWLMMELLLRNETIH